jgi:hypothetical protein
MTTSCWLYYDVMPPFYEAIGLNVTYNALTHENSTQCSWGDHKRGLTIQQVSGQGTCLGKVPREKQDLCATIDNNPIWGKDVRWIILKGNGGGYAHNPGSPLAYQLKSLTTLKNSVS